MSELERITGGVEAPVSAAPTTPGGAVLVAPTAPYMVTIRERDPPGDGLSVALGPSVPHVSEGGGGWEEISMPKRGAVAVWNGRGLMRMSFDVRFEHLLDGTTVGPDMAPLLAMYRPAKDTTPPPIVKVAASGDTLPYASLDWTIESLEWGAAEGNEAGQRIEQTITVNLREFRPDQRLQTAKKAKQKTKPVKIKNPKKETLAALARQYHVKGGAKALAKAQHPPIKDPRHVHKGQTIIVPLP